MHTAVEMTETRVFALSPDRFTQTAFQMSAVPLLL